MSEAVIESPAPAPVDSAPVPVSASDQAITSNDVSAFKEARRAERQGKPLEPKPLEAAKPGETPAQVEARTVSKRQQQINDYERRIAEQTAEIARLKSTAPAVPTPRAEPRAVEDPEPNPADTTKYPNGEYDAKYIKDLAAHAVRTERAEWQKTERDRTQRESLAQHQQQRRQGYEQRILAHLEAEPGFLEGLNEEVRALRPVAALQPNEQATGYTAIAEEIMASELAVPMLKHFSAHPKELHRIAALMPWDLAREMGKLTASLERPSAPPPPKPVTSMAAPPTTLGTKSTEPVNDLDAAVASGDMSRFKEVRLKQRAAALSR